MKLYIWIHMLLAVEAQLHTPTFDLDFCALSPPYKLHNHTQGLLTYYSRNDRTRYEWCTCSVCDTSPSEQRYEMYYVFRVGSVILTKLGQSFSYTYLYGLQWKVGEWKNNTKEGTFQASLFNTGECPTFTIELNVAGAIAELQLDFKTIRAEVTITCSQKGTDKITDLAETGLSADRNVPHTFDIKGLGIGLGLSVAVVIIAVGGLCVYCKVTHRNSSQNLTVSEAERTFNGVSNPYPSPKAHRDVNTLIVDRKPLSMLGYDNVTSAGARGDCRSIVNTDYEPGDSPNPLLTVLTNTLQCQGHDQASSTPEVNEPLYHILEESESSNIRINTHTCNTTESCLPLPETIELANQNAAVIGRKGAGNGEVIGVGSGEANGPEGDENGEINDADEDESEEVIAVEEDKSGELIAVEEDKSGELIAVEEDASGGVIAVEEDKISDENLYEDVVIGHSVNGSEMIETDEEKVRVAEEHSGHIMIQNTEL